MGWPRNLGSALSFGSMETTKTKEAREQYADRHEQHENIHRNYEILVSTTNGRLSELISKAQEGRQAIINTRALSIDDNGNLQAGWYPIEIANTEAASQPGNQVDGEAGLTKSDAAALATAIGAPATAWIAVGALGTASTGTAIGSLSGAAATAATAAWFGGGSLAAGGLGIAAAPFTLTAIAAVPILAIGFWKSRQKEKERLAAIHAATAEINQRERDIKAHRPHLESILNQINPALDQIQSITAATRQANENRRTSITRMRMTLSEQRDRIGELAQGIRDAIRETAGTREENAAITGQARDLASATTEFHSEAQREESAVNADERSPTHRVMRKLTAIDALRATAANLTPSWTGWTRNGPQARTASKQSTQPSSAWSRTRKKASLPQR